MKQLQLSKNEIAQIFKFVQSKYVRYKDVQYELVDHLASNIEEQLALDSSIGFEVALQKAYSEFPKTGFTKFVAFKSSALNKYWRARFFGYFKQYFKLPKLLLTLTIAMAFYLTLSYLPLSPKAFGYVYLCLLYLGIIISLRSYHLQNRKNELLLVEHSYYGVLQWIFIIPILFIPSIVRIGLESQMAILVFSIICAFTAIGLYGLFVTFPEKLKYEIEQKYAHLA